MEQVIGREGDEILRWGKRVEKESDSDIEERERIKGIKKTNTIVYNTVIKVRRYYSSIGKKFAILSFYKFGCWGFWGFNAKSIIHLAFDHPDVNALRVYAP